MQTKLLNDEHERTWALVFAKGDAVMENLQKFAEQNNITGAHFTAIGAFQDADLYYFDWNTKDYQDIPVREQVEVLTLAGNVSRKDGKPKVHAHVVLGRADGTTRGGHLKEAHVRPTLEVILTEEPEHLRREHDEETGLALIRL